MWAIFEYPWSKKVCHLVTRQSGEQMNILLLLMLLYIHRDHKVYYGRKAHDGHLDFHTAPGLLGSEDGQRPFQHKYHPSGDTLPGEQGIPGEV